MAKEPTSEAIQAVAFIMLCDDAGVHPVDACMALQNGQAANQLARAAEARFKGKACYKLLSGWLPRGWKP